jgi:RimJ/RimL family protein N-acetyltransferase
MTSATARQAVDVPAGTVIWRASRTDTRRVPEAQLSHYFSTRREECLTYLRQGEGKAHPGGPWLYGYAAERDMRFLRLDDSGSRRLSGKDTRAPYLAEIASEGFDAVIYGEETADPNGAGRAWDHVVMAREGVLREVSRASIAEVAVDESWELHQAAAPAAAARQRQGLRTTLAEPLTSNGLTLRLAVRADLPAATALLAGAEAPGAARRQGSEPVAVEALAAEFIRRGELLLAEDGGGTPIGLFRVAGARTEIGWTFAPGWAKRALHPFLDGIVGRLSQTWDDRVTVRLTGAAPYARAVLEHIGFAHPEFGGSTREYRIDAEAYADRLPYRGELPRPAGPKARGGDAGDQVRMVSPEERRPKPSGKPDLREVFGTAFEAGTSTMRLAGYEDVNALWNLVPERETAPGREPPSSGDFERRAIAGQVLAVEDATGALVGSVTVLPVDRNRYVLGWQVREDRRGEGIGSAAAEAVAGRLLAAGAAGLICGMASDNAPSLRIAERLGFSPRPSEDAAVTWLDLDREAFELRPGRDGKPTGP